MNVKALSQTQFRRSWLTVARATWLVLVGLSLALFAAGVVDTFAREQAQLGPPVGIDSLTRPFTLTEEDLLRVLEPLGLTLNAYAWYITALDMLQAFGFALVGVVIFWRRSDDWFGLLVSLMLVTFGVSSVTRVLPPWVVLARMLYVLGLVLTLLFFFLFPDGRLVPRWAWVLGIVSVVSRALYLLPDAYHPVRWPPSPAHLLGLLLYGAGVLAQIYRYRRVSSPAQRQQTKWVVWGPAIASAGIYGYVLFTYAVRFELIPWLMQHGALLYLAFWRPVKILALLVVPLTIGFSILRRGLWEIDLVIRRSLVYGALTALLAALFASSLLVVSLAFQALAGGRRYAFAVIAAALLFGALFQPVRQRLRRTVDRHLYGIQVDYQKRTVVPKRVPSPPAQPRIGAFTAVELLGRGGIAVVYRAQHPTLHCPVAIKVLSPHLVQDARSQSRFSREAEAMEKLEHPHIVQVYESGQAEDAHYIVMEYIAGPDLGGFLEGHGRLPLPQALPILRDVAQALDYAHSRGVIHRDVKPSNIMLDPVPATGSRDVSYRVVIADFGLARILDESTRLSHSSVVGTFSYIAPEQIQSPASVDGRADVYALGVTAYQMLTGELPFKHRHPGALLIAHLTQPPPDPRALAPDLPGAVVHVLLRALAKKPEDRYPTAGEFAHDLIEKSVPSPTMAA